MARPWKLPVCRHGDSGEWGRKSLLPSREVDGSCDLSLVLFGMYPPFNHGVSHLWGAMLPTGQGALADPGTHLLENSDEKQRCERRLGATQPPSAPLPGPGGTVCWLEGLDPATPRVCDCS